MKEEEITIKELLNQIKDTWYIAVAFCVLFFLIFFTSNYRMFLDASNNAYFTKEIDIDIEIAKTTGLKEIAEEVIRSEIFRERASSEYGCNITEEFLNDIVYGQTSSSNPGSSIYKVRVLASSRSKDEIMRFEKALKGSGVFFLESAFDSPVSIESKEMDRIVAGKGANLNLASPYDMYVEMHRSSVNNLIIWFCMAVTLGIVMQVAYILFVTSKEEIK